MIVNRYCFLMLSNSTHNRERVYNTYDVQSTGDRFINKSKQIKANIFIEINMIPFQSNGFVFIRFQSLKIFTLMQCYSKPKIVPNKVNNRHRIVQFKFLPIKMWQSDTIVLFPATVRKIDSSIVIHWEFEWKLRLMSTWRILKAIKWIRK